MIPLPSLSPSSLKSALVYHLIIPLVILFPALVLQPQPYFPAPKFLIHSSPPPTSTASSPSSGPLPDHVVIVPQAFQMDVYCHGTPTPTCSLTRHALQRAGSRLANVMQFRAPVVARVDVSNTRRGALGWGVPAVTLPVRHVDDDVLYMYPRALVKQMPEMDGADAALVKTTPRDGVASPWGKWDVHVEVNAEQDWWVEGAGVGHEIQRHQYDLEYVMLHELLHSLGFGHDEVLHHLAPLPSRLSPAFDSYPYPQKNDPSGFVRFSHPSIWNRFTLLHHTPVIKYKQVLDNAVAELVRQGQLRPLPASPTRPGQPKTYRPADVYLALAGHTHGSRAMRDMYDWSTTNGSLVFDTRAWPPHLGQEAADKDMTPHLVELETGLVPFDPASSVGHMHVSDARTSAESLMGWQLKRGVSLSSVASANKGEVLGPQTRAMLSAMGYTMLGASAWKTRRGVARVDMDELARMMAEAAETSRGTRGKALADGMAWVGVVGLVVVWGVHRGWWV